MRSYAFVDDSMLIVRKGIMFAWNFGPYIGVHTDDDLVPEDVINVWDYVKDCPIIPLEYNAMVRVVNSYLEESEQA